MATEAQVLDAMMQVEDPELGVNVVDLGLIYGVDFEEEGRWSVWTASRRSRSTGSGRRPGPPTA